MKTVAIVGMATSTRDKAPWKDEPIEIWTLNESPAKRFDFVKRVTRHFQLHPKWDYDRETNMNDPEHPQWLREQTDFPIYMQEVDPDIKMSKKYPLEAIFKKLGIESNLEIQAHKRYFTSSLPYMIAFAIHEGFERIELYGFEMASDTEYAHQKGSATYWLGIAEGMGVDIYLPDGCQLLGWNEEMYGYQMTKGIVNQMSLEIRINKFKNEENLIMGLINKKSGVMGEWGKQINDQTVGKGRKERLKVKHMKLGQERQAEVDKMNYILGRRFEAESIRADLLGIRTPSMSKPVFK